MKSLALASLLVGSALAVACGGHTFADDPASLPDAASDAGGGGDAGGDGGIGDGGVSRGCPASPPTSNSVCSQAGLACEYGNDPNATCNTLARCESGVWHVSIPGGLDTCPTPGVVPGCPPTFAQVPQGQACSPNGLNCGYPQGRCACTYGFGGPVPVDAGGGHWNCENPAASCPTPRPRIGSPCAVPDTVNCDYGGCFLPGGTDLRCVQGIWTDEPVACPANAK